MAKQNLASADFQAATHRRPEQEINALARTVAKSISEQLRELHAYSEVEIDVPELAGINPLALGTRSWSAFSLNVQYATLPGTSLRYMHLKHFKLEVGKDHLYTGKVKGRLIDDTWSL